MKAITKKRWKAYFIDLAVSTAVTACTEYLLRKKIKNEAIHAIVTPTLVMWSLEYIQLARCGQTIGYKQLGLTLEDKQGGKLTSEQILKRMAYRDTISTFSFIGNREGFEQSEGALFPHDRFSETIVTDK